MRCHVDDFGRKRISVACRQLGVTDNTYDWWRKDCGGIRSDQPMRLKEPEKENARLKKLVAEPELDKAILRKQLRKTSEPGEASSCCGA